MSFTSLDEKGGRRRSTAGKVPDLPKMPPELLALQGAAEWQEELQKAWKTMQRQLIELEDQLRELINDSTTT